jgi:uncharacterized protein
MSRRSPGARVVLALLGFYRKYISPGLPPTCRFYPSCSAYAVEAVTTHGVVRGCWLATLRLLRCHPWHPGGVDPVPPLRDTSSGSAGSSAEDRTTGEARDREEQAPC